MCHFSRGIQRSLSVLLNRNLLNTCNKSVVNSRTLTGKTQVKMGSVFKLSVTGITMGALVGTGYTIYQMNKYNSHFINEELTVPIIGEKELPKIKPSRKIRYPEGYNDLKLILYQYQTCPFCCKVRAFMDYHGISYDVIEVDPVLRQSIKWSEYKKVPILVAKLNEGYQPLNDSSMIISALSSVMHEKKNLQDIVKYYPSITYIDESGLKRQEIMNKYFLMMSQNNLQEAKNKEFNEERKWRKWADDVLVHVLSPNVYRTREEAFQAFNWFSQVGEWDKNFPTWERRLIIFVGASSMWLIGKRLKQKYNLKDDVRESLYDECNYWIRAINKKGTPFMGGQHPNLADLAVFGILSSIEGCTAFKDLLKHSKIQDWYFAMKTAVKGQEGLNI